MVAHFEIKEEFGLTADVHSLGTRGQKEKQPGLSARAASLPELGPGPRHLSALPHPQPRTREHPAHGVSLHPCSPQPASGDHPSHWRGQARIQANTGDLTTRQERRHHLHVCSGASGPGMAQRSSWPSTWRAEGTMAWRLGSQTSSRQQSARWM